MKIRLIIIAVIAAAICGALYVYAGEGASSEAPAKEKPAMTKAVYVCPQCHMVALKPGKCSCGAELQEMHLLGIKDGQAMLCACGADCKCDAAGVKDGKCACGKEVKMASVKGLYCCPKGCPVLSDKPGKCACGGDMVKAE